MYSHCLYRTNLLKNLPRCYYYHALRFASLNNEGLYDRLKQLDPIQFLKNKIDENDLFNNLEECRISVNNAIKNYNNVVCSLSCAISDIQGEIYESLQNLKPFNSRYKSYELKAQPLPNGGYAYFLEKNYSRQLIFDTSEIAREYSKNNYCVVKDIKFLPKVNLICIISDVEGKGRDNVFIKDLMGKRSMKILENVANVEILESSKKCWIFYTRHLDNSMELRLVVHFKGKLLSDSLIFKTRNLKEFTGLYKARDSKMVFVTSNTSFSSKLLHIIKLNNKEMPKFVKLNFNEAYDKLFLEHRQSSVVALYKTHGKYYIAEIPLRRKFYKGVVNWDLDKEVDISNIEVFKKGIIVQGYKNQAVPLIGLIKKNSEIPELKQLIDCGAIKSCPNPDFNADFFHFSIENPLLIQLQASMDLSDSSIKMEEYSPEYKFSQYFTNSFDGNKLGISIISMREGKRAVIYFYGFSNQLLTLNNEYDHLPLLRRGYKLCYIHSRSDIIENALSDIVSGTKYLLENGIISPDKLIFSTESAGAELVVDLLEYFREYNMTFMLKSPHLPMRKKMEKLESLNSHQNKRIFMSVGLLDEKTPWWESFAFVADKNNRFGEKFEIFLDLRKKEGHDIGKTHREQILHAAERAAIIINS